jgi:hypothetical protein
LPRPKEVLVVTDPLHHRRSIRLPTHDYATPGAYFVTICTRERECVLGDIVDGTFVESTVGGVVRETWASLPCRFPALATDAFVVMPNHVHGVLVFEGVAVDATTTAARATGGAASSAPTLGRVVRVFKSMSAVEGNRALGNVGPFWQRNYFERVV